MEFKQLSVALNPAILYFSALLARSLKFQHSFCSAVTHTMLAKDTTDCCRDLWEGLVPIAVSLAPSDSTSNELLDPVHVLVPRYNFLPVVLAEVVTNFQQNAIEFSSDVWFENCGGEPLRCQLPVGVLHDLYSHNRIPWEVTVHFQHFPSQLLVKCASPEDSEHFFFHSLKQAVFLLYGSTRLFNELSVEVQHQLWNSVQTNDHNVYRTIADQLISVELANQTQLCAVKSLPVRVVRKDKPTVQRPISLFVSTKDPAVNDDTAPESADSAVQKTLRDVLLMDLGTQLDISAATVDTVECVIHGIGIPLDAPIFDLWRLMCHCDLFLYVVVRSAPTVA